MSSPDSLKLRISKKNLDSFLACLGLGTLIAIQKGVLPASAGIWTLGLPRVHEPLVEIKTISRDILEVFSQADELSALQEIAPTIFNNELDKLIERLQTVLAENPAPFWDIDWLTEKD
jgi:hypothetical protein